MATTTESTDGSDTEPAESEPIDAGITLAEAIQSTLGPSGMDKMLVGSDGRVVVTNDGASILDRLDITEPIGNVLENMVRIQRQTVGDGTTTTLLLTGGLLSNAQSLREHGLHPTTIIEGYSRAATFAQQRLSNYTVAVHGADNDCLHSVAETAVTGRWDDQSTELFASRTLSALRAVDFESNRLSVDAYPGGDLRDSSVVDGVFVDLETSSTTIELLDTRGFQHFTEPRLVLVGSELTVETPDRIERASVTDPQQVADFRSYDKQVRDEIVEQLRAVDADIVCCQKSIDEAIRTTLAAEGILAVERTRQDEFDAIAQSTGTTVVQSLDELSRRAVGCAASVQRKTIGSADVLTISGTTNQPHATLCMRGGTPHVSDEIKRIARTTSTVVQRAYTDGSVIAGGGATAMAVAQDLSEYADGVSGRHQLAVRAFADALERIPGTLAANAGANPLDTLAVLRNRHSGGASAVGVDRSGTPRSMIDLGVLEPRAVFEHGLRTALEATSLVLRIDSLEAVDESTPDHRQTDCHEGCDHHDHSETARRSTGGYPWALSH